MKTINLALVNLFSLFLICETYSQKNVDVSFSHYNKTVYGTLTIPKNNVNPALILIVPGSGPNDRDGTITFIGPNSECLYPELVNLTFKPYKVLADRLVEAGYAVFRYDKVEFTYSSDIGEISFEKLWLVHESALEHLKQRNDINSKEIYLLGHSEGSSLIPLSTRLHNIKGLISLAGPATSFDTILSNQIINIGKSCNGNLPEIYKQSEFILDYFNKIRNSSWNNSTISLFGVPPSEWSKYIKVTDNVIDNYNESKVPILFIGLEYDINVPPSEINKFTIKLLESNDFIVIPQLNHYLCYNDKPLMSNVLSDTIISWLHKSISRNSEYFNDIKINLYPNPAYTELSIEIPSKIINYKIEFVDIHNRLLDNILKIEDGWLKYDIKNLKKGIYFVKVIIGKNTILKRFIKI